MVSTTALSLELQINQVMQIFFKELRLEQQIVLLSRTSTGNLQGGARKILWDVRMSDIPMKLSKFLVTRVTISGNMTF